MENDNNKNQTTEEVYETVTSLQRKDDMRSSIIKGRPNIDEISKRNEKAAREERKLLYKQTGIVALLIIVASLFVYFSTT